MTRRPLSALILILVLQGCARGHIRDHHSLTVIHPEIERDYRHSNGRFNAAYSEAMLELDRRIRAYLRRNPGTSAAVTRALMHYQLSRGMTRDEVLVLIGSPDSLHSDKESGIETWFIGGRLPFAQKTRLSFDEGRLVHIQSRTVRMFPY